jgi:Nitroreductase family
MGITQFPKIIMTIKNAATDHPILELLSERWSPYGFEARSVPEADLRSLFEAARWAASSYNEQPWNYLVATREDSVEFARLLGCLVEANQAWAKNAPVLVLRVVSLQFAKNEQDNRAAVHDLGLAAGNLLVEATARGLFVHQMIGILPRQGTGSLPDPGAFRGVDGPGHRIQSRSGHTARCLERARPDTPAAKAVGEVRFHWPVRAIVTARAQT